MHDLALWHLCTKGRITGRTDQMVRFPAAFHRGTLRVSTGLTTSCACRNGCAPRCQQTQPPGTQRCIWPGSISGGLGICQCNLSKARGERRDEGTAAQRHEGTEARRDKGTEAGRHGGTKARQKRGLRHRVFVPFHSPAPAGRLEGGQPPLGRVDLVASGAKHKDLHQFRERKSLFFIVRPTKSTGPLRG